MLVRTVALILLLLSLPARLALAGGTIVYYPGPES